MLLETRDWREWASVTVRMRSQIFQDWPFSTVCYETSEEALGRWLFRIQSPLNSLWWYND